MHIRLFLDKLILVISKYANINKHGKRIWHMAFMVNLKEVYIDPADVEAYLTEIANLWQGEEDNYENEAVTSQIMDFVYNKDTDDAHFTFDKADNELVMRKGKDFYQLIRQIRTKVDSEVPADVTPLVAQTINQNVQQNLRMRMQMQSGPFAQTTSRGYIARQQSEGNN